MSLVYFTDRDLGKRFPAILQAAGLHVEPHHAHFPPAAPDEDWLKTVGVRGWVAITHDRRIRYKPNELQAVNSHRVALLVVVGEAPFSELAASFVITRNRIEQFVARHTPPFIGKVYRASPAELERDPQARGRVELWYPPSNAG